MLYESRDMRRVITHPLTLLNVRVAISVLFYELFI